MPPEQSLAGKTVVVTGAGRGIGKLIVSAFLETGANVACVARSQAELNAVVEESNTLGSSIGKCEAMVADVADPDGPAEIYTHVVERFGAVDVLINNAGVTKINTLEHERDFKSWWRVLEVNLRGPAALMHQVLPGMLRRGSGTLISIGSRSAAINMPYSTAYSTSKTALLRLHQCLELEIQGRGVNTFVVEPGDVATSLAHAPGAIDLKTIAEVPALHKMLESTIGTCTTSAEVVARTCVGLVIDKRMHVLSGMYFHAEHGIAEILEDLQKETGSRVRSERLYELKVDEL